MNKQEFLAQLRKGLSGLPKEDIDERLTFYSEMMEIDATLIHIVNLENAFSIDADLLKIKIKLYIDVMMMECANMENYV